MSTPTEDDLETIPDGERFRRKWRPLAGRLHRSPPEDVYYRDWPGATEGPSVFTGFAP